MRCPSCGAKKLEDIFFFKSNSYFCKRCDTVSAILVTELSDIQVAVVKAFINEEKKRKKKHDKEAQVKEPQVKA